MFSNGFLLYVMVRDIRVIKDINRDGCNYIMVNADYLSGKAEIFSMDGVKEYYGKDCGEMVIILVAGSSGS